MERLQRELKAKDETVEALRAQISAMEDMGAKREREVDILRQSLRIMSNPIRRGNVSKWSLEARTCEQWEKQEQKNCHLVNLRRFNFSNSTLFSTSNVKNHLKDHKKQSCISCLVLFNDFLYLIQSSKIDMHMRVAKECWSLMLGTYGSYTIGLVA